jgi:hypothetical protein
MTLSAEPIEPPDLVLIVFLQTVERSVVDAYDQVLALLGDAAKSAVTKMQAHHKDYVDALGKLAGAAAVPGANQTLSFLLGARLQTMTDEKSALTVASSIENQLAATYGFAFTTITSPDVVKLLATIMSVVSTHAAALAGLAVLPTASAFPNGPFEGTTVAGTENTDAKAGFDPAAFPVG